jgi:hypothetical protein
MKSTKPLTHFATAILILLAGFTTGNCQSPWTTNGNAPSPNCFIGTTTPSPLVLKTNGMERRAIDANGTLRIAGLASADTAAMVVLPDGSLAKAINPDNGGGDCNLLIWDGDENAALRAELSQLRKEVGK